METLQNSTVSPHCLLINKIGILALQVEAFKKQNLLGSEGTAGKTAVVEGQGLFVL